MIVEYNAYLPDMDMKVPFISCKWFDENDSIFKRDLFFSQELILVKEYESESNPSNSTARK